MPRSSPYAVAVALLLVAVGSARAGPRGLPYLPPDPSAPGEPLGTADPAPATQTEADSDPLAQAEPTTAEDLLNRFGGGQDDFIHFDSEVEERPLLIREREVSRAVSRGVTELTLRLDRALGGLSPNGGSLPGSRPDNVVFSPLSVAVALALLLLGSGGRTHQELAEVLGLNLRAEDTAVHQHFGQLLQQLQRGASASTRTLAAQGVFVQKNLRLRQRFLQVAKDEYRSEVVTLDFVREPWQAQQAVNSWVAEKTRGRITGIMSEPPPQNTRLVLATALYFNGQWEHPFPKEDTKPRRFFVTGQEGDETLEIDMMANTAYLPYGNNSALGCQVLGLPYKGGQVVMYLVLPHQRGASRLKELEATLSVDDLDQLVASAETQEVDALIPRMRLEFSASLAEPLQELGVVTLFDSQNANLSQLASGPAFPPLYVDQVLHKVEVEVTETGTVATAATLALVSYSGLTPTFRADRPFLFFIRHQPTGLLLFWGSVVRPTPA